MDTIERIYSSNIAFVENENFKGVKKIIVDNYSDEAHFVYEMLQNADDAKATEITFDLRTDALIVSHNGIAFNEKDLEGICSISKGTKSDDYTKIGKFGIGFKSVFVYTESPQVHSGSYDFEIRELVLPSKIEGVSRENDETIFVLPFNSKKTKDIAWDRINNKLENLHEESILFLKNIKRINTIVDDDKATIEKTVLDNYVFYNSSEYEHVRITKLDTGDEYNEEECDASFYFLFRRNNITLLDTNEDGDVIEVPDQSAMIAYLMVDNEICTISDDPCHTHEDCYFVFFPTRIKSNCEFFIHAPFVTKSSRDTIALNNVSNDELMKNIGKLVADSMIVLAKEKQLSVELMEKMFFANKEQGFGDALIYDSFKEEYIKLIQGRRAIIPCNNNLYKSINSVLFTSERTKDYSALINLFGMKWLSDFFNVQNASGLCWVSNYSGYFDFIQKELGCRKITVDEVVRSLDSRYYEEQSTEWFKNFVDLLVEKNYYGFTVRFTGLDKLPLIRTNKHEHRSITSAGKIYLNNGTLDEELLSDPKVNYLYKEVFKLKDYSTELSDANEAIKLLSSNETQDFNHQVEALRKVLIAIENKKISTEDVCGKRIILVCNQKSGETRKIAPKDALVGRWERNNGTFDLYILCENVDIELIDERYLEAFSVQELRRIGCKTDGLSFSKGSRRDFFSYNGMKGKGGDERHIRPLVGKANNRQFQPLYQLCHFEEILNSPMSIEKSVIILRLAKEFDNQIKDWVQWSSRQDYADYAQYQGYEECYSLFGASLVVNKWMINKRGDVLRPKEVTSEELADEYRKVMTADIADKLGLKRNDSEKLKSMNQKLESDGYFAVPLEEKEAYEEFKKQQLAKQTVAESWNQDENNVPYDMNNHFIEHIPDSIAVFDGEENTVDKATTDVIRDIARRTSEKRKKQSTKAAITDDDEFDSDELSPSTVDYSKKIEREKEKSVAAIERISYLEELQKVVDREERVNKYSYRWFTTLLELESLSSGEANDDSREVSISFAKIEREPGTKRTLVLKHPNKYIPHFMEDLADIPMVLHFGEQTKTVAIEVANIKSYTLRVKLKSNSDIEGVDLDAVTSISIDAKSPTFLLEELRKQFAELGFDDEFNMQKNLCENIEFVFGPPGTGKTTHLAKNILLPLMRENKECKVLVLTPTNKSADVLARRIMEVSGDDRSYEKWLIRFGATGDEEIEQSTVFRDKTFDIRTLAKSITVTTIARFPYDYFMPQGARLFLYAQNWDYIVIDEASMIPIANIVFPLYKKTPKKFIIAGDPFQIEPITSVNLWKDENIYTLVQLNSFENPSTIHDYKVELLTTQYRSVPDIGYIFSNFAYGGILKHYRTSESQRKLNVGNDLGIETLNIIKFPVSKYESIYRCKKLNRSSSYQVYSALFVYEYVSYLSRVIAENNPDQLFKIGIIAPYRAQADMIDKLLASRRLPKEVDVQVGTIHGFQGDECDIVFSVFNTPPTISDSKEMFLNKRNIINVSISRARDYLFIVMPDDNTDNISKLRLVKRVESLIRSTDAWQEFESPDLEELMFNDSKYLENNAFSTSHQSVNVYGLPEKCYEVRTEDAAVDVQIHQMEDETTNVSYKKEKQAISPENSSYGLDESIIPEELRKDAIDLPVKGALKGWFYLVPYEGKLRTYTAKPAEAMFIPLMRNGQEKMISVSVINEDRLIFISQDKFNLYEQGLSEPEGIELRRTFLS